MKNQGQLYLGVFSGPVEGILMIVMIFIITGFYGACKVFQLLRSGVELCTGPTFWDQKILTFTRLENADWIASRVPNVALNVCFMIFAGFALAFNIVTRCIPILMAPVPADLLLAI